MRTPDHSQHDLFCAKTIEQLVPSDHPLRQLRPLVDEAMRQLQPHLRQLYSHTGRPSIPPERLLRALLLQVLYSVRSERRLMQELTCHMAWRWFVGLGLNEEVWDANVFTKNRERFLQGDVARHWLQAVVRMLLERRLVDREHFSVDATLIAAHAGERSYQRKPDPPAGAGSGSRGELLKRDTHASSTDPDAQLYRKSKRAAFHLAYLGHLVMENRHGLIVAASASQVSTGERAAARELLAGLRRQRLRVKTVGADGAYHEQDFVEPLREHRISAHVPAYQGVKRRDWLSPRVRRSKAYQLSRRVRKRIESCFGWLKEVGGQRRTRFRGTARVSWAFTFASAALNLVRLMRLQPAH